jgi:uncharacterized protein (DUF362 family)
MDRRRFLGSLASMVGAGLLAPGGRLLGDNPSPIGGTGDATDLPDLAVARGDLKEATHKTLKALGGMQRFVQPDQVVVIKPNASFACPPDWGASTHPDVLSAVLEACFEAEARRVLVLEIPGKKNAFKRNGTEEAVAAFPKAKLVALGNEKSYRPIPVPDGNVLHEVRIPAALQKADVFINVPTLKSHAATGVSLGFKNLMGLVLDAQRFHRDFDLHMGIADLGTVLRPHLTVLDAARILKTGGPTGPGEVNPFDGVIAGVDPVAVDAYGVGLSTWDGRSYEAHQVAFVRHAAEHGLGTLDLKSLKVLELS